MLKRSFENQSEDLLTKKAKMEDDGLIEIRVLIDNADASVIIGKGGANVKRIREETSAFVSILRNDFNAKERVLTVKGTVEYIANAVQNIASLLVEANNSKKEGQQPDETVCIKVLLHKSSVGAIIGKAGAIIREIQESTGARMSVSVEALGVSTEKTCSITGTPLQIHAALTRVVTQLAENPPRPGTQSTLYVPGQAPAAPAAFPSAPFAPPAYAPPAGYPAYGAPPAAGYYGVPPHHAPPHLAYGAPSAATMKTEKIVIPTVTAGTVIGKSGSIIRDIKLQSATTITIADPELSAPADRVVSITGSSTGIQHAISLIRHRVESYVAPA